MDNDNQIKINQGDLLYEGKAKKVFKTDHPDKLVVSYKNDATAQDGKKHGYIIGKGAVNNQITNYLMRYLSDNGVPTHYIKEVSKTDALVKRVDIIPLEVIIRNISAGSFAEHYGVEEGIVFDEPTFEFSYKNDDLHDPLINDSHIKALKIASDEDIETIRTLAFKVNDLLKDFFLECGINLVDFKLEFGKLSDGTIVLADEISPDTCRFWDIETGMKLDKDRFRRDLGQVEGAYQEMMKRVFNR